MIYHKNVSIATGGTYKIIDMIAGKKLTILSYSLTSIGGNSIRFKSNVNDLTSDLTFRGNSYARLSDNKSSGLSEITGLFHANVGEDIFLSTAAKVDGTIIYADEFN